MPLTCSLPIDHHGLTPMGAKVLFQAPLSTWLWEVAWSAMDTPIAAHLSKTDRSLQRTPEPFHNRPGPHTRHSAILPCEGHKSSSTVLDQDNSFSCSLMRLSRYSTNVGCLVLGIAIILWLDIVIKGIYSSSSSCSVSAYLQVRILASQVPCCFCICGCCYLSELSNSNCAYWILSG